VAFWNTDSGLQLGVAFTSDREAIVGATFSPDGKSLVTTSRGGGVALWDVSTRTQAPLLAAGERSKVPTGDATAVGFSPDGRLLAFGMDRGQGVGTVHIVDLASRRLVGEQIDLTFRPYDLAWSPDSTKLGVVGEKADVNLYSVKTHERIWTHSLGKSVHFALTVSWSPDGASLAVGDELGRIVLLDAASGEARGAPVGRHVARVWSTAFSPDGSMLASAGSDGKVVLVDVATGEQIGKALPASDAFTSMAKFDAHGHLFVWSDDGALWRWDAAPAAWLQRACAVAGRQLTPDEWAGLHTGARYRQVCP
jgi:WD40 repeat protein